MNTNPSEEGLERPAVTPIIPDNQDWLDEVLLGMYDFMKPEPDRLNEAKKAITTKLAESEIEALKVARHDVDFAKRWNKGLVEVLAKMDKRIAELEALKGG